MAIFTGQALVSIILVSKVAIFTSNSILLPPCFPPSIELRMHLNWMCRTWCWQLCCHSVALFLSLKFSFFITLSICCTVHGVEYAFGAHDYSTSGVFEVEPRQCPGFKFRKSIFIGTTSLDPLQVREFMECNSARFNGDTYHLIVKNCNHFCKDICYRLTGKHIPKWVNRLARIGKSLWHPTAHKILYFEKTKKFE